MNKDGAEAAKIRSDTPTHTLATFLCGISVVIARPVNVRR